MPNNLTEASVGNIHYRYANKTKQLAETLERWEKDINL